MKFLLTVVLLLSVAAVYAGKKQPPVTTVVGGYFPNWPAPCNRLTVDTFDPTPFTHLWYAFGIINTTTWLIDVAGDDQKGGVLYGLVQKKKKWPGKVLISLGGAVTIDFFTPLTSNSSNTAAFVSHLVPWLRAHNLDGVDFDWEFPAGQDAINYNTMFGAVQAAFKAERRPRGVDKLILTTASYGDAPDAATWPIAAMNENLDWFNIMLYEEHGPWDDTTPTGMNAPLRSNDPYNVEDCVTGYIAQGASPDKIVLGAPTFAHSWILANKSQHGVGAPGAGPWPALYCTQSEGYMAYFEVQEIIKHDKTIKVVWDKYSETPYIYNDTLWVSYDNPESFLVKAAYTIDKNLKGFMLWSIPWDNKNEMITPASNLIKSQSAGSWGAWLDSIFGDIFGKH